MVDPAKVQFKSVLFCCISVLLNNTFSLVSTQKSISLFSTTWFIYNLFDNIPNFFSQTYVSVRWPYLFYLLMAWQIHPLGTVLSLTRAMAASAETRPSTWHDVCGKVVMTVKKHTLHMSLNVFSCAMSLLFVRTHTYRGSHWRTCDPSHGERSQEQPSELFKHKHTRSYSCPPHRHQS